MSSNDESGNLDITISRLYSQDANDRVKAAGELGEIGTPEVAPKLLEVAYEDEASTVRQMAIQSYSEILGEDSLDDIIKAAESHFDQYVQIYAIMVLGRIGGDKVGEPLSKFIQDEDKKVQASALRAMIHAGLREYGDQVFSVLREAEETIIIRNCIEALALWKYKDAKDHIKTAYFENEEIKDREIKTISAFYLASFGEKAAKKFLDEGRVDSFISIQIDDTYYRGRQGLKDAVSKL